MAATATYAPEQRRTLPACPRCGRQHRSWYSWAGCRWKRGLLWVQGNPPAKGPCWAVASLCGRYAGANVTVTLWPTLAEAEKAKGLIDRLACGGALLTAASTARSGRGVLLTITRRGARVSSGPGRGRRATGLGLPLHRGATDYGDRPG